MHITYDPLLKRQILAHDSLLKRQVLVSNITGHLQNIINQLVDIAEQISSALPLPPIKQDERSNYEH